NGRSWQWGVVFVSWLSAGYRPYWLISRKLNGRSHSVSLHARSRATRADHRAGTQIAPRLAARRFLLRVFLHLLPLQIGPRVIEARIGFAEQYGLHFNLLGRLDVFDKFSISFRERDGVVIFEPVE